MSASSRFRAERELTTKAEMTSRAVHGDEKHGKRPESRSMTSVRA